MKGFNISLEDVEIKTHSTLMDPQVKAVFSSIVDVVNAGVETYIEKHGYNVEVPEGVPTNKAYQIAVEEIEDEFETKNSSSELTGIKPEGESDPVGGDVSSIMKAMIDDLADRTSQDAKRVAETIIQMERERQNQLKSEDSEMENAEDMIDSEEMSDEEMDDIDDLDVEDPNKSDDENPLEDSEIEESLNDELLQHTPEMIELQNMTLLGNHCIAILDEDEIEEAIKCAMNGAKVYVANSVFLTAEQIDSFGRKQCTLESIPDYYFNFELKEVGE